MLFKILHGDTSRISTDITPFHEGYCYVTHDGHMYIDINIGTQSVPDNQRIKLNAKDAETLTGASLVTILNSSNIEIPTSKAVLDALAEKAEKVHTHGSDSFIMTDTVTGAQYNLYVTNGKLTLVKVGEGVITGYEDGDGVAY